MSESSKKGGVAAFSPYLDKPRFLKNLERFLGGGGGCCCLCLNPCLTECVVLLCKEERD